MLTEYLQIGQQPQIRSQLMRRRTETRQRGQDVNVDFARVCLGGDRVRILESGEARDQAVQLLHLEARKILLGTYVVQPTLS